MFKDNEPESKANFCARIYFLFKGRNKRIKSFTTNMNETLEITDTSLLCFTND